METVIPSELELIANAHVMDFLDDFFAQHGIVPYEPRRYHTNRHHINRPVRKSGKAGTRNGSRAAYLAIDCMPIGEFNSRGKKIVYDAAY